MPTAWRRMIISIVTCLLLFAPPARPADDMDLSGTPILKGGIHPGKRENCSLCDRLEKLWQRLKQGFSGEILVGSAEDAYLVKEFMKKTGNNRALVVVRNSSNPGIGLAKLSGRPSRVNVYHGMPLTKPEVVKVHGDAEGGMFWLRANKIRETHAKFEALATRGRAADIEVHVHDLHELRGADNAATRLRTELAASGPNDLNIVNGHVNSSGEVVFYDGSVIPLSEIKSEGTTLVFGCRTYRFDLGEEGLRVLLTDRIGYGQGAQFTSGFVRSLSEAGGTVRSGLMSLQISDSIVIVTEIAVGVFVVDQGFTNRGE
jgi:hypothetical protein